MKRIYINAIFIALLSGCSTQYDLKPSIIGEQQDLIYNNGVPIAVSTNQHSTVLISAYKNANGELILHVVVKNESQDKKINFFPDKIKVEGANAKGKISDFKVYSADEYLARMQRRQNFALAMQALSAGMNAAQAGYSQSTTNTSTRASVHGTYGSAYGSAQGTSTTTTYDNSKVAEAQARNNAELK